VNTHQKKKVQMFSSSNGLPETLSRSGKKEETGDRRNYLSRHGADVGASMSLDLGHIGHSAHTEAEVLAVEGARYRPCD